MEEIFIFNETGRVALLESFGVCLSNNDLTECFRQALIAL